MSLSLQACRSPKPQQTAYLLLALYTEVAALYRSPNGSLHPEAKVSSPLYSRVCLQSHPIIGTNMNYAGNFLPMIEVETLLEESSV